MATWSTSALRTLLVLPAASLAALQVRIRSDTRFPDSVAGVLTPAKLWRAMMIYEQQAHGTLNEVVDRLTKAAAENKLGIISQLDLRGKLHDKGIDFDHTCWVVEVCNPMQAKQVLEADMRLANLLPCRIAIYEKAGQLMVGTLRPSRLVQMLGTEGLAEVASEVEEALISIIGSACEGA